MSVLHVGQIQNKFHEYFDGKIDLSDCDAHSPEQREKHFLARALAAFAVSTQTDVSFEEASEAVTDEPGDGGIDAIYWDEAEKTLHLVQSKWHEAGTGTIDEASMLKFLNGVHRLISARYDDFLIKKNDGTVVETRVYKKQDVVQKALKNASAKVRLVICYTGVQDISEIPRRALDDFLKQENAPSELFESRVLNLAQVHGSLDNVGGKPTKVILELTEWGSLKHPCEAFYGQVSGKAIAEQYDAIGPRLFAPNIRLFLGGTSVNDDIVETALNSPEKFWYCNNGITAIGSFVKKLPYGGGAKEMGIFECEGFHVVNGAQTVGALHKAYKQSPAQVEKLKVHIRIINLQGAEQDFGDLVTRRTNTQNGINKKDFAALDAQQSRLQRELRLEGITYAVKPGEQIDDKQNGFDFVEAMSALACFHGDLNTTVTAKREVSKLWEDISKPPYTTLVNEHLHGLFLWKLVQIQRIIEIEIDLLEDMLGGRESQILVHGNRLIERVVMRLVKQKEGPGFAKNMGVSNDLVKELSEKVAKSFLEVTRDPKNGLTEAYPGNIFKNRDRCRDIEEKSLAFIANQ